MESPTSSKMDAAVGERTSSSGQANNGIAAAKRFHDEVKQYWLKVPTTVDSMIFGHRRMNDLDIKTSKQFLHDLKDLKPLTCLDCGAGIGRVTKSVLMPYFQAVDIVEQDIKLATHAYNNCVFYLYESAGFPKAVRKIYWCALQEFVPHESMYNLVWCQWVLRYMTDEDIAEFLSRIRGGLTRGGYLVIKETVSATNQIEQDAADSSYIRPLEHYKNILETARCKIEKIVLADYFPPFDNPVYMIACRWNGAQLGPTINKKK